MNVLERWSEIVYDGKNMVCDILSMALCQKVWREGKELSEKSMYVTIWLNENGPS